MQEDICMISYISYILLKTISLIKCPNDIYPTHKKKLCKKKIQNASKNDQKKCGKYIFFNASFLPKKYGIC